MEYSKRYFIITIYSIVISMILVMISPGIVTLGEESKSVQKDGAVEITSTTFESNTVSKDIKNNLRIEYNILDKDKLKENDKISIVLPGIFKNIEPKYHEKHFKKSSVKDGVVTLTFNKDVKKAVAGYMIISFVGNDNIRNGVNYPVNINLNGKPSTIYIKGEEHLRPSTGGKHPIMYKTADLPVVATDDGGKNRYYGEITNKDKPIQYYVEINAGDGINPSTRDYLGDAIFNDNIPKGMVLDVNSISIDRSGYYSKASEDVTKELWDRKKIKADSKHLKIDFGNIRYEHYSIRYQTKVTSTERGYLNNATLTYDGQKSYPSSHYSRLSKEAGALNAYKEVDKTRVKNDPNDQKVKYMIKFEPFGHFKKGTLEVSDVLNPDLSDIKVTSTGQFGKPEIIEVDANEYKFDYKQDKNSKKKTKKIIIKNSKGDIDEKKEEAYITIEASMKNVKPGENVINVARINGNPTNKVSTKKNPLVKIVKIPKGGSKENCLEGAVFRLTTKDGHEVKDVYNKAAKVEFKSKDPVKLELPDGDYKLQEIKAPEGYRICEKPIYFTVNDDSKTVEVIAEDEPLEDSCNLVINKIDEKENPILGAKFNLFKNKDKEEALKFSFKDNNYKLDNTGESELEPLGSNASFKIENLPYGDYILKEVKAPRGYKRGKDIYITLNSKKSFYKVGEDGKEIVLNKYKGKDTYNISVKNNPGIVLPETGGSGTFKFSLLGTILLSSVLINLFIIRFTLKEGEKL